MNEMFLNMYVIAVETGRLTIDFIPMMYKREVARILGIGEVTKEG